MPKMNSISRCDFIFILTVFLLVTPTQLHALKPLLLPIDSLYMNSIEAFYDSAEEHKDEVWPGVELSPVAFYRVGGSVFLYNHPDPSESFTKITDKISSQ